MPKWTEWRKIAQQGEWYAEELDWDGPACYELGTGDAYGENIEAMYVGETSSEKNRISTYACNGSHLNEIIDWHLKEGWCLYYRAKTATSKMEAASMQNELLDRYDYDWNIQLNN